MGKIRQVVLFSGAGAAGGQRPLGTRREVLATLARYNTAPDGLDGDTVAYGPGLLAQFPMGDPKDDIAQVLVSINEDEIAWPVLERLCRQEGWKMMDPESGRTFGGA